MENLNAYEVDKKLLELRLEKIVNISKAQNIVLKHLEKEIEKGHSATVVAMAEILKL